MNPRAAAARKGRLSILIEGAAYTSGQSPEDEINEPKGGSK